MEWLRILSSAFAFLSSDALAQSQSTTGPCSPINTNIVGNVTNNCFLNKQEPYDRPPHTFFMGGLALPNKPVEASFMVTNGYSEKGGYGPLSNIESLEVYAAGSNGLTLLSQLPNSAFRRQVDASFTRQIVLPRLDIIIVTCLVYSIPNKPGRRFEVQSFEIRAPQRTSGSAPTVAAAPEYNPAANDGATCGKQSFDYANRNELLLAAPD